MPKRTAATHETVVLRLKPKTAQRLREAGARDNRSLEEVLEADTEEKYAPRERIHPLDSPTIKDPKTKAEITRLLDRAKELR